MAVAFRSASTGTTFSTALPTGHAVGDILFAQIYTEGTQPMALPTTATGWTYIDGYTSDPVPSSGDACHWYWIARGASNPATNWAQSGATHSEVCYVCYSGANTTIPFDSYTKSQDSGAGTSTVSWPAANSAVTDCMEIGLAAVSRWTSSTLGTWANERADGGATIGAHFFDNGLQPAGVLAAKTTTADIGWHTIHFGLKPAADRNVRRPRGITYR